MKSIKQILMDDDGLTESEAINHIEKARPEKIEKTIKQILMDDDGLTESEAINHIEKTRADLLMRLGATTIINN